MDYRGVRPSTEGVRVGGTLSLMFARFPSSMMSPECGSNTQSHMEHLRPERGSMSSEMACATLMKCSPHAPPQRGQLN